MAPTVNPNTRASPATATPTMSEVRAPKMTATSTSRPRSSVPKGCADEGLKNGASALAKGSPGAMIGASIAASKAGAMSAIPIRSAASDLAARPSPGIRGSATSRDTRTEAGSGVAFARSRMRRRSLPDPRIDHGIKKVRQEIRKKCYGADANKEAQQQRIVAIERGYNNKTPKPGPRKHGLDEDSAR